MGVFRKKLSACLWDTPLGSKGLMAKLEESKKARPKKISLKKSTTSPTTF